MSLWDFKEAEVCPLCGQAITPGQWIKCVVATARGGRAHLACLEAGREQSDRHVYFLAPRTINPQILVGSAVFCALVGDKAIIAVPYEEIDPFGQRFANWTGGHPTAWYTSYDAARRWAGDDTQYRFEPDIIEIKPLGIPSYGVAGRRRSLPYP